MPTLNKIEVPRTNVIESIIKNDRMVDTTYFADSSTIPRPKKITLDNKVAKDEWNKNRSVFRNYKLDTPALLKKCFDQDWENSNFQRIVKEEFDRNKLKEYMQSWYIPLREWYKHYAGTTFAKNVPCIGSNAMTELLMNSSVIDNKLLKISDFGKFT